MVHSAYTHTHVYVYIYTYIYETSDALEHNPVTEQLFLKKARIFKKESPAIF